MKGGEQNGFIFAVKGIVSLKIKFLSHDQRELQQNIRGCMSEDNGFKPGFS